MSTPYVRTDLFKRDLSKVIYIYRYDTISNVTDIIV